MDQTQNVERANSEGAVHANTGDQLQALVILLRQRDGQDPRQRVSDRNCIALNHAVAEPILVRLLEGKIEYMPWKLRLFKLKAIDLKLVHPK